MERNPVWVGLKHRYWPSVSAIVVIGSDTAVTFTSCRDRMLDVNGNVGIMLAITLLLLRVLVSLAAIRAGQS